MTDFHAVMLDETRCEFGVSVTADSREAAHAWLRENYPESSCVQLESPEDRLERERAMHLHISRGGDWDDDGRPIFHEDWDDEDIDDFDLDEEERVRESLSMDHS